MPTSSQSTNVTADRNPDLNGQPSAAAYRFTSGEWKCVSAEALDALCDLFGINDPGPLFERKRRR